MTSAKSCKTSCGNPERTWFVEMLGQYKMLPVLIAAVYFLSNILPILLSYSSLENVIRYVHLNMIGGNTINYIIGIAGGVIVSCAVFRYLHNNASVIDAHARPLTRVQLFRGSFFAGLIMILAPVVLTGLFYLCVTGAHGEEEALMQQLGAGPTPSRVDPETVLTAANAAGWMLDNIVVIGFTYCVSCLAAILTGTAAAQALMTLVLAALPTMAYWVCNGYMSMFLFGYSGDVEKTFDLSPYGCLYMRDDYPFRDVPVGLIVYSLIAAAVVIAAVLIYKKIKLEKEERTITVPYIAEILVILLSVICVSAILFVVSSAVTDTRGAGAVITVILATAVVFPVLCMVSEQSFRIFKRRNLVSLTVYAAVMCLILAFTLFDVTGFEKKVPQASEIESVDIGSDIMNRDLEGIKDKDTIEKIRALHESVVADVDEMEAAVEKAYDNMDTYPIQIEITYKEKNGKTVNREFEAVGPDFEDAFAEFYDSEAVRKRECIDAAHPVADGQLMTIHDIHVDADGNFNGDTYLVPEDLQAELARAANKDILKWTADQRGVFDYDDPAEDKSSYMILIDTDPRISADKDEELSEKIFSASFTSDDKNLEQFIDDHPELLSEENKIKEDSPLANYYNY